MKVKPLVSILIPCYNAERWIGQCIQSALDQTYPRKEVIVIDDGSTDSSVEVIRKFGDRIHFQQSAHRGGNAIRNQLTQTARGDWLQYLDSDDYLLPDKIASEVACIDSAGSNIDVIYSPVVIHTTFNPDADYTLEIHDASETVTYIRWGHLNTGGLLMKRDVVLQVGGWKEDQPCCQEHELLLRLMVAGHRFLLHHTAGVVYRQHSSATVSRRNPLLTIRTRMELTERMEKHLELSDKLTPEHKEALFIARMECARSARRMNPRFAQDLSRQARTYHGGWVADSAALPRSYQIALRLIGFANTEQLADWARVARSALQRLRPGARVTQSPGPVQ